MYCINCGKELIPNKKFCSYCGAEVVNTVDKEEKADKVWKPFCQYCGAELEPEDKFCLECGKEVPKKKETNKETSIETEAVIEEATALDIPQVEDTVEAEFSAPIEEPAVEEVIFVEKEPATVHAETTNVAEEPVDETPAVEVEPIVEEESVAAEENAEDTMEESQEEVPDDTNEDTEESIEEASMFAVAAEEDTVIPAVAEEASLEAETVSATKSEDTPQANEATVVDEIQTETAPENDAGVSEETTSEESKEVPTKRRKRWLVGVIVLVVIAALAAAGILYYQWSKVCQNTYQEALTLLEEEHYNESLAVFTSLGSYKDAQDQCAAITAILDAKYEAASDLLESEEYKEALAIFESLKDYKDSEEQCKSIRALIEEKAKLEEGITLLLSDGTIIHPEDSADKLANCDGAVVRFNGEVVTDYQCDIDGKGTTYTMSGNGRFRCETDEQGKLYLWTLDSKEYILRIAYRDEIFTFYVNASGDIQNSDIAVASAKPAEVIPEKVLAAAVAKEKAPNRPDGAVTKLSDQNGNRISSIYPNDYSAAEKYQNYVVVQFYSDVIDVAFNDVYFYDENGNRLEMQYAQAGVTEKTCLIVAPYKELECGHLYYLYIPAGSIHMANGTTYDEDIHCQFVYTEGPYNTRVG